ncbi:MAG: peptidyl-prolyl cis-trans isomerase [Deltaproteobacteria bacterium]|nr:peptidyl-prolyl cis-trans isomerase [Deltaproteobacteria bacterium]
MAQKGEGFAKLAKEYSQGPNAQDGGDLGYVKAGEMDKAIEKAAAALNIGETSDIIKTATGFHIIRLEDKRKAEPKPFSAVEDDIKNIIFQKIIDERYRLWLDGMMKKAYIEVRL